MSKPKQLSETPITLAELKKELDKIRKRDGELGFRGQKTEDYLNSFCSLSEPKANELLEELKALNIPRATDVMYVKIVDMLPKDVEELKVILQAYSAVVTKEQMQKIVDVVKKFL